jgi:uncharacterized membrane protein
MNIKRERLRYIILFIGWAIFIISFFVPAVKADEYDELVPGWLAALFSLAFIENSFDGGDPGLVYFFSFTLCNILMLMSPIILFLTKKKKFFQWYRISMVSATLLVCSWFFYWFWPGAAGDLLIGYYMWFLSFILVTISLFMRKPQNKVNVDRID